MIFRADNSTEEETKVWKLKMGPPKRLPVRACDIFFQIWPAFEPWDWEAGPTRHGRHCQPEKNEPLNFHVPKIGHLKERYLLWRTWLLTSAEKGRLNHVVGWLLFHEKLFAPSLPEWKSFRTNSSCTPHSVTSFLLSEPPLYRICTKKNSSPNNWTLH